MGRISEETIARVAAATDIVEVIGSYIPLKRAGSIWKALCPFHHEKSPSFMVTPSRQSFKCFGCGAGGSVFRFIMDYEHVEFAVAVKRLAQRAGIPVLEDTSLADDLRRGERDRVRALHRDAAAWYHANLMRCGFGAPARDYLKSRGVNSDVAARWQLGYAPDSWNALIMWARESGFTAEELAASGLVSAREQGEGTYDRFRHRLMFPIRSDYGEVIAFSGRTLGDDPAKYINSPETILFSKGRVVFGLEKTKRAIIEANQVVVCEGQFDLITAFEAGVRNVVAPQGTAFTVHQARLLRRFAESVVLCFDADAAGQNAVDRSLPALLAAGLEVRVARMPQAEDPDSLVRRSGAEALHAVIRSASDYFDHAMRERHALTTPAARAKLARQVAGAVALISDPAMQETTAARVSVTLGLSIKTVRDLMASERKRVEFSADQASSNHEAGGLPETVRVFCRLALADSRARGWLRNQPLVREFGPDFELVEKIIQSDVDASDVASWAKFLASLSASEERSLAGLRLDHLPEDPAASVSDAWAGLLEAKILREIEQIQLKMRTAPDLDSMAALNKQILDLQSRLTNVRRPF